MLAVRRRTRLGKGLCAAAALTVVGGLAAGCGGSNRLSASAYRARLATIAKEATKAETGVEQAFRAKSVAEIRTRLSAFASAEDGLGDEVGGLKPPKDAAAANAELARGEHDTAAAVRSLLPRLAAFTNPKAALGFIEKSSAANKAGREQDHALKQLKKLGYTSGS
jgi:hypothetical protein